MYYVHFLAYRDEIPVREGEGPGGLKLLKKPISNPQILKIFALKSKFFFEPINSEKMFRIDWNMY